ncbi:MAG TPA: peptidoglycan editing factor PgeF [Melioribacteraceae bacterium]|nr:peptidoglycan editing factor PgeF [Melioribacteraceae bacterium]
MKIIVSNLFKQFKEIIFGFSTKIGPDSVPPFFFNLSLTVGDDPEKVKQNREYFFNRLGLSTSQIAFQRQVHSDIIKFVEKPGLLGESDALITRYYGIGLAISAADCTPIFIYDKENKIIAGVHSGWKGTQKRILKKVLSNLSFHFKSKPKNLYVFLGPSISQENYEVGKDVALLFDQKYLLFKDGRIYLDVPLANFDMLLTHGIPPENIEMSRLCTFKEKVLLHSYRRDGNNSGRMFGVIALKEK